jgi:hypothetical protein
MASHGAILGDMTVLDEWKAAPPLPSELDALARRLAREPAAEVQVALPVPPGINGWWEPYTLRRRGAAVASLRLTREAVAYKRLAERTLLERGIDPVELEDLFRDLWLELRVVSYLATPLERDADGPVKPLQDLFCALLGVDDARVRSSSAALRLDPITPRVEVGLRGHAVWDSSGEGGPYYLVATRATADGPRTEPRLLTPRRARILPMASYNAQHDAANSIDKPPFV